MPIEFYFIFFFLVLAIGFMVYITYTDETYIDPEHPFKKRERLAAEKIAEEKRRMYERIL